jgi:hypothetical protein
LVDAFEEFSAFTQKALVVEWGGCVHAAILGFA